LFKRFTWPNRSLFTLSFTNNLSWKLSLEK
jgi:hypothetical protein